MKPAPGRRGRIPVRPCPNPYPKGYRMARRLFAAAFLAVVVAAPVRAAEVDVLLPAETEAVMFVNVRQILDSDLVKKYALGQVKQALQGNENQKLLKDLGLDPLKDIDRVTVGSWGKGPED